MSYTLVLTVMLAISSNGAGVSTSTVPGFTTLEACLEQGTAFSKYMETHRNLSARAYCILVK